MAIHFLGLLYHICHPIKYKHSLDSMTFSLQMVYNYNCSHLKQYIIAYPVNTSISIHLSVDPLRNAVNNTLRDGVCFIVMTLVKEAHVGLPGSH